MLDGIEELTLQVSYLIPFIWFYWKRYFKSFPVTKYTFLVWLKFAMWFVYVLDVLIVFVVS